MKKRKVYIPNETVSKEKSESPKKKPLREAKKRIIKLDDVG